MLNILKKIIQNFVKYFGFKIIFIRSKLNFELNNNKILRLNQKHINNLKVVLNRENLLNLLPKNGIIAELGVDKGDFSQKIIELTKSKKLFLIDIWGKSDKNKMNYVKRRFEKEINNGRVVIIRGASEKELKNFENGYFDWIYIDTTHSYIQTLRELELCQKKVKDGGIIAGHDYCKGNIDKALSYGVVPAVNQFCIKYDWEFVYITHESNRNLSFALRKIRNY